MIISGSRGLCAYVCVDVAISGGSSNQGMVLQKGRGNVIMGTRFTSLTVNARSGSIAGLVNERLGRAIRRKYPMGTVEKTSIEW